MSAPSFKGSLLHRRAEHVVHYQQTALGVRKLLPAAVNVGDLHERVRRRFQEQQFVSSAGWPSSGVASASGT